MGTDMCEITYTVNSDRRVVLRLSVSLCERLSLKDKDSAEILYDSSGNNFKLIFLRGIPAAPANRNKQHYRFHGEKYGLVLRFTCFEGLPQLLRARCEILSEDRDSLVFKVLPLTLRSIETQKDVRDFRLHKKAS